MEHYPTLTMADELLQLWDAPCNTPYLAVRKRARKNRV